jgi:hypothetical protein
MNAFCRWRVVDWETGDNFYCKLLENRSIAWSEVKKGGLMMEDRSRQYEIPDLRENKQVMNKITELEREISNLINKDVSLIVYAKDT